MLRPLLACFKPALRVRFYTVCRQWRPCSCACASMRARAQRPRSTAAAGQGLRPSLPLLLAAPASSPVACAHSTCTATSKAVPWATALTRSGPGYASLVIKVPRHPCLCMQALWSNALRPCCLPPVPVLPHATKAISSCCGTGSPLCALPRMPTCVVPCAGARRAGAGRGRWPAMHRPAAHAPAADRGVVLPALGCWQPIAILILCADL